MQGRGKARRGWIGWTVRLPLHNVEKCVVISGSIGAAPCSPHCTWSVSYGQVSVFLINRKLNDSLSPRTSVSQLCLRGQSTTVFPSPTDLCLAGVCARVLPERGPDQAPPNPGMGCLNDRDATQLEGVKPKGPYGNFKTTRESSASVSSHSCSFPQEALLEFNRSKSRHPPPPH